MEDMDTIIKPRPTAGAKQRRGRPKSIHRDSMDSPKTPVRAATGNPRDDRHSERSNQCLVATVPQTLLRNHLMVYIPLC